MATIEDSRSQGSPFMRLPAELRLMVYRHLLSPNDADQVFIKTRERTWTRPADRQVEAAARRTSYYALDRRSLGRCSYKTTYGLDTSQSEGTTAMYPAIMAVNRRIYEETAYHLYASHSFHFDQNLDAVGPFIGDLTPSTQSLIHSISLHCLLHSPSCCAASDWRFWSSMSQRLGNLPKLRKLKLTVQGGQPTKDWDGPKSLSVSDIKLLYATQHECLDWARELAAVESLEEVEIEVDVRPMPKPETTSTLIYAALSASIGGSLIEFLNEELNVPARLMVKPPPVEEQGDQKMEDEGAGSTPGPEQEAPAVVEPQIQEA